MTIRALVYVQHLLGIGHLARIGRIAESLAAAGVRTTMAQGGPDAGLRAPQGVDVVRLAPVKVAADDMSALLHPDGRPFTAEDQAARRDHLLATLRAVEPDILVVEAFPFGRRQMRFELLPLLAEAEAIGVRVMASSIRDILQDSRKPGRAEEAAALVERWFDVVLVHGDAGTTPLSMTFPLADRIADKLRYTGLVGPPSPQHAAGNHAVVVSAGGGVVGAGLLRAAVAAAPMTGLRDAPWLLLAGTNLPEAAFAELQSLVAMSSSLTVLRSVPDLPAHLLGARVSVSQAGYNTVADVLAAGCRAVLAPFAAGGETEQSVRAAALAAAGRAVMLPEEALTAESLAEAIDRAAAHPAPQPQTLDGGARTAELLLAAFEQLSIAKKSIETSPSLRSCGPRERT